jgi:hypothetical protein
MCVCVKVSNMLSSQVYERAMGQLPYKEMARIFLVPTNAHVYGGTSPHPWPHMLLGCFHVTCTFSQSYSRVHPHNVCLTFNLSIVPIKISFHNIGWPWLWPCHRRGQWPCVKKKGDGVCVCVGGGAGVSTKILFKDLTLYEHFQICLIVLTSLHDSSP